MNKVYTFWVDPGHSWLEVSIEDLKTVGLKQTDFSEYSYRLGGRFFLEEDDDAPKFLKAAKLFGIKASYVEEIDDHSSWVRDLPSLCPSTV